MSEQVSNEVAVRGEAMDMGDVVAKIKSLSGDAPMVYSTFAATDFESQKRLLNAVTDAEQLRDHVGKKIMLKDFVVQATTMIDQDGMERDILRTVLVAADGKAYSASSDGIFKALQTFGAVLGHPSTWPEGGVAVVAKEVQGRRGFRFLTIKLA